MDDSVVRELASERALAEKLGAYAGEWVAITDHEVVAHAESLEDLASRVDLGSVDTTFQVLPDDVVWIF